MASRVARIVDRALSLLSLGGLTGGALCLSTMLLLVVINVVTRKFFNYSIIMTEQLSGYLLVGMASLGQAYTLKSGGHVSADVFFRRLSPRVRLILSAAFVGMALFYAIFLTIHSGELAAASLAAQGRDSGMWRVPLFWPQLVIPAGFGMLSLQLVAEAIDTIRALRKLGGPTTSTVHEVGGES
ncbi:MAG: TRAP transporter small permease [Chloroflexi bacterium]|nr:TRAP transporter small permease [Chloroflexota bacterium]